MIFTFLLIILSLIWQNDAATHFAAAQRCEVAGNYTCAEREYEQVIQSDPRSAVAFNNLGIVRNRLSKPQEAITAFTRAAELDPKLLGAHLNLGITYFRLQRYKEAEKPLRRALAIQSNNSQASQLLALTLFAQGRNEEVAQLTEQLLSTQSDNIALLEVAGRAYIKLHRYKDAVQVLEKLVSLQPKNAEAHLLLGEARDNNFDKEGAIQEFKLAIEASGLTPLPDAHFELGYVLWKLQRFDDAESEFQKELERDSTHAPSTYYLGNIALERGDWSRALPLLEKASGAIPESFSVHYDFGKALLQAGQAERAIEEFKKAIDLNPKDSTVHYQLGQVFKRLKREDEARREFAKARELSEAERREMEKKVQSNQPRNERP